MASNNLRIIYQNAVDIGTSTVTTSTTNGSNSADNMRKDAKSLVWRSAAGTNQRILLTSTQGLTVGGIILPFCNLTSTATIRIRLYSSTSGAVATYNGVGGTGLLFDSGAGGVVAAPYQVLGLWNWGTNPLGSNVYSYGGGTYGRVWLDTQVQNVYSIAIDISDPGNLAGYIEASRLVVGWYWSPKYNTSYGLATTMKDLSTHERSEAGDLVTNRGVRFNSMNFDMNWLVPADQLEMQKILRGNGIAQPLLISLFPNNSDDWVKEQSHQIYGKLSQLSSIVHPILDMYSTSIDIEEI